MNAPYPWPDTPIRTYQTGAAPVIVADDLNDLQEALGQLWGRIFGRSHFAIDEEFQLDSTTLSSSGPIGEGKFGFTVSSGNPRLKLNDSVYTGTANVFGFGRVVTNDGNACVGLVQTTGLGFGLVDCLCSCRVVLPARTRCAPFEFGFANGPFFRAGSANANWQYAQNVIASVTATSVPVTNGAWYTLQAFRIGGVSGVVRLYINGTLVAEFANTDAFAGVYASITGVGSLSAGDELATLDYVRAGCARG